MLVRNIVTIHLKVCWFNYSIEMLKTVHVHPKMNNIK